MSEDARRWEQRLAFIEGTGRSVIVFEPDPGTLDSFCSALRTAGQVPHGYATIEQAQESTFPHKVEYVFFNTRFGQEEKPHESWSVFAFLAVFSIDVEPDRVQTYYTDDVAIRVPQFLALSRDAMKYNPLWLDLFFALPTSPVVRDQLHRYRSQTWFELLIYASMMFVVAWGIVAVSPTLLLASALLGSIVTAFSLEEIMTGLVRVGDKHDSGSSPDPVAVEASDPARTRSPVGVK